jgi:hypothetical protein
LHERKEVLAKGNLESVGTSGGWRQRYSDSDSAICCRVVIGWNHGKGDRFEGFWKTAQVIRVLRLH